MQVARTKCVIGDPSYFMDKVKKVGQVWNTEHGSYAKCGQVDA